MKIITAIVTVIGLSAFAGAAGACPFSAAKATNQTTAQNAPPLLPPQTPTNG